LPAEAASARKPDGFSGPRARAVVDPSRARLESVRGLADELFGELAADEAGGVLGDVRISNPEPSLQEPALAFAFDLGPRRTQLSWSRVRL
jgi:hypothetical protein